MKLIAGEIASSQAVRASLPFFAVCLAGVGLWCVVCGGVVSGRAGTGYEVGGWGERHGALNDERALWLECVAD